MKNILSAALASALMIPLMACYGSPPDKLICKFERAEKEWRYSWDETKSTSKTLPAWDLIVEALDSKVKLTYKIFGMDTNSTEEFNATIDNAYIKFFSEYKGEYGTKEPYIQETETIRAVIDREANSFTWDKRWDSDDASYKYWKASGTCKPLQ